MSSAARRSDFTTALAMTVSGFIPAAFIGWLGGWSTWSSVCASLAFWPFALAGGVVFTRKERRSV